MVHNLPMVITGEYNKRNKLYSKGKWVKTLPLMINSLMKVVHTSLTIFEKNKFSMILYNSPV